MSWRPPSRAAFEPCSRSRHCKSLRLRLAAEKTRLKQCDAVSLCCRLVSEDVAIGVAELTKRVERAEGSALLVMAHDKDHDRLCNLLQSVPGAGEVAGVQVLAELAVLPADISAKQWVAHAGLDHRRHESGMSVRRPSRISEVGNLKDRLRFLPAREPVGFIAADADAGSAQPGHINLKQLQIPLIPHHITLADELVGAHPQSSLVGGSSADDRTSGKHHQLTDPPAVD